MDPERLPPRLSAGGRAAGISRKPAKPKKSSPSVQPATETNNQAFRPAAGGRELRTRWGQSRPANFGPATHPSGALPMPGTLKSTSCVVDPGSELTAAIRRAAWTVETGLVFRRFRMRQQVGLAIALRPNRSATRSRQTNCAFDLTWRGQACDESCGVRRSPSLPFAHRIGAWQTNKATRTSPSKWRKFCASGKMRDYSVGVKFKDGTVWLAGRVTSEAQMQTRSRWSAKSTASSRSSTAWKSARPPSLAKLPGPAA